MKHTKKSGCRLRTRASSVCRSTYASAGSSASGGGHDGATAGLRPADGEVESILEIPLDALCDRACQVSSERELDGRRLLIPAFHVAGHEIWGATAMVLAEFLSLLGWPAAF